MGDRILACVTSRYVTQANSVLIMVHNPLWLDTMSTADGFGNR